MSTYSVTLTFEVDDALLAEQGREPTAPPPDVEDWNFSDLYGAIDLGIVDLADAEFPDEPEKVRTVR